MYPQMPNVITLDALQSATSSTRREVAREWWKRCTAEAQHALLNDENSLVKAEAVYSARDTAVAQLAAAGSVSIEDIRPLDRGGRFRVCTELWSKCTPDTQHALLNDEHHFVRSAALIEQCSAVATGADLVQHDANPGLFAYVANLTEAGESAPIQFNCWAEDEQHAKEQAEDAYQGCVVHNAQPGQA